MRKGIFLYLADKLFKLLRNKFSNQSSFPNYCTLLLDRLEITLISIIFINFIRLVFIIPVFPTLFFSATVIQISGINFCEYQN